MSKEKKKKLRIEALESCIKNIENLSKLYIQGRPAWILIQNAWGHINSVHHLETSTNFDEEILGIKNE